MPKFVISYDLLKPGKDYARLWAELQRLNARRILLSQWAGRIDSSAVGLRDHLQGFMDPTDRLLVINIDTADWAAYNLTARLDSM